MRYYSIYFFIMKLMSTLILIETPYFSFRQPLTTNILSIFNIYTHTDGGSLIHRPFGDNVSCSLRSKNRRKNAIGDDKAIYGIRAKPYNSVCGSLPCLLGRQFTQSIITYRKLQITLTSVDPSDNEMQITHILSGIAVT